VEGPEETSSPTNQRILVAEDNVFSRALMEEMLTRSGVEYKIVENGIEAVEAFRNDFFDVILMDLQMPLMDGFEAARQLRDLGVGFRNGLSGAGSAFRPFRLIALTADAMDALTPGNRDVFDDFLVKPIQQRDLLSILSGHCAQEPDANASPDPEILDSAYALKAAGGVRAQFVTLVRLFLKHIPALLSSLDNSLRMEKYEDSALHAHSLQGSAASIGGLQLAATAGKLSRAARARSGWPEIGALRELIDSHWIALRGLLDEINRAP